MDKKSGVKFTVFQQGLNDKKIKLKDHDDKASANKHMKKLKKLYKEYINVGVEKQNITKSIDKCSAILREKKNVSRR